MTLSPRARLDRWMPTLLLVTGSLIFLGAGRHHPVINASIGPLGTDQFYRTFAEHMLRMPNWESVHLGILVGPILWTLGVAGLARVMSSNAVPFTEVGKTALLLGAGLWAIAFVLDGYVGPRLAAGIADAGLGRDGVAIKTFSTNQYMMARLGMLSVVLMGGAVLLFSGALLLTSRLRSWPAIVGGMGVLVGGWPLIAAMQGEFFPGPFTSSHWTATALSFGLWFLLFGTATASMQREV